MKKSFVYIGILVLSVLVGCSSNKAKEKENVEIAAETVPLADPFILLHNGVYYAYGTHSDQGIEVYTSDDLNT